MAKRMYIGVDNKARKVKQMYVGVSNKARRVKKGYIGIGGVARPFFSFQKELTYYGTITGLDYGTWGLSGETIGDYALFAGGVSAYRKRVCTYNSSLTKGTAPDMSVGRYAMAATTIGNYALFAGGEDDSGKYRNTIDTYNSTLTKGVATSLSNSVSNLAATSCGSYALFAGGSNSSKSFNTVNTYNSSLTRGTATALSSARAGLAAATIGNYALFAGGTNSTAVDAYNSSLSKMSMTGLQNAGNQLAAAVAGNLVLFGGQFGGAGTAYGSITAYDSSLTRYTNIAPLSVARFSHSATSVGGCALFAGGRFYQSSSKTTYYNVVDVYDASLTRSTFTPLSNSTSNLASTTIGDYALFAGGTNNKDVYSTVDVYAFI